MVRYTYTFILNKIFPLVSFFELYFLKKDITPMEVLMDHPDMVLQEQKSDHDLQEKTSPFLKGMDLACDPVLGVTVISLTQKQKIGVLQCQCRVWWQ